MYAFNKLFITARNVEGDEKIFAEQRVHEICNEIVYQPNVVANTNLYRLLFSFQIPTVPLKTPLNSIKFDPDCLHRKRVIVNQQPNSQAG